MTLRNMACMYILCSYRPLELMSTRDNAYHGLPSLAFDHAYPFAYASR